MNGNESKLPVRSYPQEGKQTELLQRLLAEDSNQEESLPTEVAIPEEQLDVLVFQLGGEHYGIDIHYVAEIVRYKEPAAVPHTVDFLDGIISVRGRMIPVINGRRRLGHEPAQPDKKTRIVVLQDGTEFQGIIVDSTSQVVPLLKKDIEPTPPVVTGFKAEFLEGVFRNRNQLIILLNLQRFLQYV